MRQKPDFSDALTSIDWADRQIDVLSAEFAEFTAANPYTLTYELDAQGETLVYAQTNKPVTRIFGASVAAILQAQRSSLDFMAVALAEANGAVDPTSTYFPITKTLAGLSDPRTLKKVRALDTADQRRIFDLKPYGGGNKPLFALHELNIEKKHRRLGILAQTPSLSGVRSSSHGDGRLYGLRAFAPGMLTNDRHLVAALRMKGHLQLDFAVDVAFRQVPGTEVSPPVIPLLREFSALCRDIARHLAV